MPIKSKFDLPQNWSSFEEELGTMFTDREKPLENFKSALQESKSSDHNVLVFHGVGGQGKTWLCKKLISHVKSSRDDVLWAEIDLDEQNAVDSARGLLQLRRSLGRSQSVKFFSFDIAIARYWELAYPEADFKGIHQDLFKSGESVLSDLANTLAGNIDDAPQGVGIAFRALNFLRENVSKYVIKNSNWAEPSVEALVSFETLEKPKDIARMLPYLLAADLKSHRRLKPYQKQVVFVDTYEAICNSSNGYTDQFGITESDWVRDLVRENAGVLFVLFSRDEILWDVKEKEWGPYLKNQHQLAELSEKDTREYLNKIPVEEPDICSVIINASGGHPYYLYLEAQTYLDCKNNGDSITTDKFGGTYNDIQNRFLRYRTDAERETFKVLSATERFDQIIFDEIIREFKTGYPLTAFDKLTRYSFVLKDKSGQYYLHKLIRDHLLDEIDYKAKSSFHTFYRNFYESKIDDNYILNEHQTEIIINCLSHMGETDPKSLVPWLKNLVKSYKESEQKQLIGAWRKALFYLSNSTNAPIVDSGYALNQVGKILQSEGQYSAAEVHYRQSLSIYESAVGRQSFEFGSVLNELSMNLEAQDKLEEAESCNSQCLSICAAVNQSPAIIASLKNNLGHIKMLRGDYSEALIQFKAGLDIRVDLFGEENLLVAQSKNNLATLYLQIDDKRAKELFKQSLAVRRENLEPDHPLIAESLNNLANYFLNYEDYQMAKTLLEESDGIVRRIKGEMHPDVARIKENLGISLTHLKRFDQAESLMKESYNIRSHVYDREHAELAKSHNNLGFLYLSKQDFEKARIHLAKGLKISQHSHGPLHLDTINLQTNLFELFLSTKEYENASNTIIEVINNMSALKMHRSRRYSKMLGKLRLLNIMVRSES